MGCGGLAVTTVSNLDPSYIELKLGLGYDKNRVGKWEPIRLLIFVSPIRSDLWIFWGPILKYKRGITQQAANNN